MVLNQILALARIRAKEYPRFMRWALELLTEDQVLQLHQRIIEWMNQNPPGKSG